MGMSLRIHSIDLYYGILNVNLLARFHVYPILSSVGEKGGLVDYGYATTDVSILEASKGYALSCCM